MKVEEARSTNFNLHSLTCAGPFRPNPTADPTRQTEFLLLRSDSVFLSFYFQSQLFSMDSQTQNTSLQRLQNVEKRIVKVLELAGSVMDELANPTGPRRESINNHVREFMQLIKDIQMALRDEIKSACDYRPFEKCDYSARIANEICCKKLERVMSQLDGMKETIDDYHTAV